MSELTVRQVKEEIKIAEQNIWVILKELEEKVGLPLDNIDFEDKWFQEETEDGSLGRSYRKITGVKIELDFNE